MTVMTTNSSTIVKPLVLFLIGITIVDKCRTDNYFRKLCFWNAVEDDKVLDMWSSWKEVVAAM